MRDPRCVDIAQTAQSRPIEARCSRRAGVTIATSIAGEPQERRTDPKGKGAKPVWYAIWTRSHFEQIVHDELGSKGFETFLPKSPTWIKRVDGRHRVEAPLFPSYVFIRHLIDKTSHVEILKARGVVRVLGDRWDRLAPIPDAEIDAIHRVVETGEPMFRYPMLHAGDRVRITSGPLQGVEGLFVKGRPNRGLLVIAVNLLQRSVAVEVDGTQVEVA